MAEAATRSSANTELHIGAMKAKVGLFGTKAAPAKTQQFDTAGPNGGVLKTEKRAAAAPVGETVEGQPDQPVFDPLGGDPGSDAPPVEEPAAAGGGALVDAEVVNVLVEEGTGEVVDPDDIRRGVRMSDGTFVDCADQLAAIVERTKLDRIDIVAFIDSTRIRRERVTGSYYVGAQDDDASVYLRLLFEGLREKRAAAVVKYTTRSRQNLGVIIAGGRTGSLILLDLVWSEDWRPPPVKATAIQKVSVSEAHVEKMAEFIDAMHDTVEAVDELRDDAVALREELRARAEAGEMDAEVVDPLPEPDTVPDLEETLKRSLDAVAAGKL